MSATNATTNYSLPLFIGTDKPAWLVDWNGAMTDIDAQMKVNATAILANETSISGLSTTVSAHTTSINTISGQITTLTTGLNTAQGNINTINSLIGNGTPTTTDHTLIGAINELHANQGSLDSLTTTDKSSLVAAINEIAGGSGSVAASAVSYVNTASGLSATDVQAAIDELAAAPSGMALKSTLASATYTTQGALATAIKTAYAALTATEKITATIVYNNQVYHIANTSKAVFSRTAADATHVYNEFIDGDAGKFELATITSASTTITDTSSTATAADAYLYA